jgi:hypothetical protein
LRLSKSAIKGLIRIAHTSVFLLVTINGSF